MLCEFVPDGDLVRCTRCGHRRRFASLRQCDERPNHDIGRGPVPSAARPRVTPGSDLQAILSHTGVHKIEVDGVESSCAACKTLAAQMDAHGLKWCVENLAWIVEQMESRAELFSWLDQGKTAFVLLRHHPRLLRQWAKCFTLRGRLEALVRYSLQVTEENAPQTA